MRKLKNLHKFMGFMYVVLEESRVCGEQSVFGCCMSYFEDINLGRDKNEENSIR